MSRNLFQISIIFLASLLFSAQVFGQATVCKKTALAALKPIPKFQYDCGGESVSNAVLETNRRSAINLYTKTLEKLTAADWWQTDVDDLRICDFRQKDGSLSEEEQAKYRDEYFPNLFGNRQFRVIAVREPCDQSGFNELSFFLLNRVGSRVFAAQIIDSFVSRADFPIAFKSGVNGVEPIIEIGSTSGGLNPTETNYYFTIDKKTNRAVPKNMFKDEDGKWTNRITSMMLMDEAEDYGLPRGAQSLQIIKNGRLAKTFDIFIYTGERLGSGEYEKFDRRTLRWNGKSYQ